MRPAVRFLLLFLLLFPARAWAWGPEGHEIIARIAGQSLTPSARLHLAQLLGGDPLPLMVLEANWADEIRSDRPETAAWHFVNIEIGSKGYNRRRDCARDNCVVRQIEREIGLLRDPRSSRDARLEAFRFLIHFVGDLHQPLHAADRRDKGGNAMVVYQGRRRTTLHRVWDQDVVAGLGRDTMVAASNIQAEIAPQDIAKIASGTPADWANESFGLASLEIYGRLPRSGPVRLPRDYVSRERAAVQLQLQRAGIRLAAILNRIYR
jgi:hypothetical protein